MGRGGELQGRGAHSGAGAASSGRGKRFAPPPHPFLSLFQALLLRPSIHPFIHPPLPVGGQGPAATAGTLSVLLARLLAGEKGMRAAARELNRTMAGEDGVGRAVVLLQQYHHMRPTTKR